MSTLPAFLPSTTIFRSLAVLKAKQAELSRNRQRTRVQREEVFQITRELGGYTDRQLADVGLSRFDIPAVAHGTYSRA